MPAGKFTAIIRKVSEQVKLDGPAKLTFEVSDGVRPMQLYCASSPTVSNGAIHIDLVARAASCKPRDRWLAEQAEIQSQARAAACCGSANSGPCCA